MSLDHANILGGQMIKKDIKMKVRRNGLEKTKKRNFMAEKKGKDASRKEEEKGSKDVDLFEKTS